MHKRPFVVVNHNGKPSIKNANTGDFVGSFAVEDIHTVCKRWNDQCERNLNAIQRVPLSREYAGEVEGMGGDAEVSRL